MQTINLHIYWLNDNEKKYLICFHVSSQCKQASEPSALSDGFSLNKCCVLAASESSAVSDGFSLIECCVLAASEPSAVSDGFSLNKCCVLAAPEPSAVSDGFSLNKCYVLCTSLQRLSQQQKGSVAVVHWHRVWFVLNGLRLITSGVGWRRITSGVGLRRITSDVGLRRITSGVGLRRITSGVGFLLSIWNESKYSCNWPHYN